MRMRQGVRTGLGHGGITCVLQTQFSSFVSNYWYLKVKTLFCLKLLVSQGKNLVLSQITGISR